MNFPSSHTEHFFHQTKHPAAMRSQFARPLGLLGRLAGKLMATANQSINRLAIELLHIRPDDQLLEIGFGPGHGIQLAASWACRGFVAGVDISEVMVRQATKRNRRFIEQGRVALQQSSVSTLPFPDRRFTKVFAVNSVQFWPQLQDDLREVRRVLQEDGLLLLCLRQHDPSAHWRPAPGFTKGDLDKIQTAMRRAGFRDVHRTVRRAGRELVAVITGRR
jgi:ubiquinone/menaquinone biosynthesis C-methylase UbiE